MRSHRCIVIVLSDSNWILVCLSMEPLIFSPSANVRRMLSSFSAIVTYSPDGFCVFQNKPCHELHGVLGGSSEVGCVCCCLENYWFELGSLKGRYSQMAGFGAFSKRNCGLVWPEGCGLGLGGLCATCSISAGEFLVFRLNGAALFS